MRPKQPENYAVIDVGTNTIKVKIARSDAENTFKEILYKDFPSGLGLGLGEDSIIDVSDLQSCYDALEKIRNILSENKVDKYECIATHALRVADNRDQAITAIKEHTGIDINVISGEEEVRLSLSVISLDHPELKNFAVINAGGGSTEFGIHSQDGDHLLIFDFGAVNLYTRYFQDASNNDSTINEVKKLITGFFKTKLSSGVPQTDQVFSMGGSIINAGYILNKDKKRDFKKVNNLRVTEGQLFSIIGMLRSSDESEKKKIPGIDEQRIETLLPGILIHYILLKLLNKNDLVVSTRNISDGILYKMILQDNK